MKTGSKRGAALVYVIVISAALLILAAGLLAAAKYNVDASQNSLESRQAYLDAKSAIEFGRAYLKTNPQSGTFSVVKTGTAAGFQIRPGAVNGAAAVYDSTQKTINAAAKYQSSDRVRRLGYKLTATGNAGGASTPKRYLVTGNEYADPNGRVWLYNNGEYFDLVGQKSEFPVVATKVLRIQGSQTFSAPEMNFIGRKAEMGANECLYSNNWQNSTTFVSDFFGFDGDIVGNAYFQGNGLVQSPVLKLASASSDRVVVHFASSVKIILVNSNQAQNMVAPVEFDAGYYSFPSGTNLFDLQTVRSKAQRLSEAPSRYAAAQLTNRDAGTLISAANPSLGWVTEGKLQNTNLPSVRKENATVFMCATSCLYQQNNKATFSAPNIVFQWNQQADMVVSFNSMNAEITMAANSISLDLGNHYENGSGNGKWKLESGNPQSHFYLTSLDSLSSPTITFVSDTHIKTNRNSVIVRAGVYKIAADNTINGEISLTKADLFDEGCSLELISEDIDSGGGSGGGATLSGGVYTDGR